MKPTRKIKYDCKYFQSNNLKLEYIENFFDLKESQFYMAQLTESVNWRIEKIKMWGKKIITKKRIAFYGEEGKSYTYSGSTFFPTQWNEVLLQLKNSVEEYTQIKFNSVLLNEYPK